MMLTNRQYPSGNGNALETRRSGPSRRLGPPKISAFLHKYANSPCVGVASLFRTRSSAEAELVEGCPELLGRFPTPPDPSLYPGLLAEVDCKILKTSLGNHTSPTLPFLLIPPSPLSANAGASSLGLTELRANPLAQRQAAPPEALIDRWGGGAEQTLPCPPMRRRGRSLPRARTNGSGRGAGPAAWRPQDFTAGAPPASVTLRPPPAYGPELWGGGAVVQ